MTTDTQMQMVLLMLKQRRGLSSSDRGATTAGSTSPAIVNAEGGTRR